MLPIYSCFGCASKLEKERLDIHSVWYSMSKQDSADVKAKSHELCTLHIDECIIAQSNT